MINNLSGHYRPTKDEAIDYPDLLSNAGLNLDGTYLELYNFTLNSDGRVTFMTRVLSKQL